MLVVECRVYTIRIICILASRGAQRGGAEARVFQKSFTCIGNIGAKTRENSKYLGVQVVLQLFKLTLQIIINAAQIAPNGF